MSITGQRPVNTRLGAATDWVARIALVLVVAVVAASCSGGDDAESGPTSSTGSTTSTIAEDEGGKLFDASVVHSISIDFDQADYDDMLETFSESNEKVWIEATVTVDGVTYERAGLRLKGNSSLMSLRGGQSGRPGGGPSGGADAESPESLPWLIRLDEFVEDQRHQGYADIVVRSNSSETSLNEAVALDLLDTTTLASQEAIFTTFSANGGDPVLRLAIEHPDDDAWQDRSFQGDGALYKAESTGDWTYRGDDPDSYAEVFDQEGGKKVADLTPLIDFLQFINESDDATFAAELEEHLDVESFATYLALMDLLENFDDIDGPGNNAYLWWDAATEQFTIVPWDMNLAFGAMGGIGRDGGPGGFDPSQLPNGGQPPAGGGGGPGGGFGRENILVQRFHEVAEFEELYRDRLVYFRGDLFATDTAESILDDLVQTLQEGTDVVKDATIEDEASALRERFEATATAAD